MRPSEDSMLIQGLEKIAVGRKSSSLVDAMGDNVVRYGLDRLA